MIKGEARDSGETFIFRIIPFVQGGYRLDIAYSGDRGHNATGAGIWPTIEKAKSIAQETASRLLHGTTITWQESSE